MDRKCGTNNVLTHVHASLCIDCINIDCALDKKKTNCSDKCKLLVDYLNYEK